MMVRMRPALGAFRSRRVDLALLALFGASVLAAALAMARFRIDPSLDFSLPEGPATREYDEASALFPSEPSLIAALPAAGGPLGAAGIARLSEAAAALARIGARRGSWTVFSPLDASDARRVGDELAEEPLVAGPSDDPARVRAVFDASPLFTRVFLSADRSSWTIYLRSSVIGPALYEALDEARAAIPELRFAGFPLYRSFNERALSREFPILLAAATLVLLAIELAITRSLAAAAFLWFFSLAPTFFLMALFAATGTPLRIHLVLAPALTLALTNSYVTHVYRGWAGTGFDPEAALRIKGKIVLLDAATTVLGYGGLFASPLAELRALGLYCIAGCAFSLAMALVFMPAALGLVRRPSAAARRFRERALREASASAEASAGGSPAPDAPRGATGSAAAPWRRPRAVGLAWAAAAALLGLASLRVEAGRADEDMFAPWSSEAREFAFFASSYAGLSEVSLVVETGRENGIVDLGLFRALRDVEAVLGRQSCVGSVYGYADVVAEGLARWEGLPGSAEPRSDRDIGETLELLSGTSGASFSRDLVDADWSAARFAVSLSPSFDGMRDIEALRAAVARVALPAGARILWGGRETRCAIEERAFLAGQVSGTFLFLAALLAGLVLVLRSFRRAAAVSIVPVTGFLASLGLMGLAGWKLSSVHAVALATIAGTGVDNALVLVLHGWTREARDASVDTTVLIVAAVLTLCFSVSFLIAQTALVCAAGLAASTAAAVLVLPALEAPRPASGPGRRGPRRP